jgi:alpha-tubulin suppressor-like RCC1 family protein
VGILQYSSNLGRVAVYKYSGSSWGSVVYVDTTVGTGTYQFGTTPRFNNDGTLLVTGCSAYNSYMGCFEMWKYESGSWVFKKQFLNPTVKTGHGSDNGEFFGEYMAMDNAGTSVIVSNQGNDVQGADYGRVVLYGAVSPPSLTFDTYNKYTFTGADTGSTYKLKYESNTYDLGTISNVYIAHPGTYSAEIKGATNFGLSSNVATIQTVTQPTLVSSISITASSAGWGSYTYEHQSTNTSSTYYEYKISADPTNSVYFIAYNWTTNKWYDTNPGTTHSTFGTSASDTSSTSRETTENPAVVYVMASNALHAQFINPYFLGPSLDFDTYNKLTFSGLESGSTSNVTFDGKTYSIGSATNIYIENAGTYNAESKGTTTFALTKKQVSSSPSDTPADSSTYNLKYTINRHPYLGYTYSRMTELSIVDGLDTHTWSKTGSFFNTDGQEYEYMFIGESSGTSTSTTVALPHSVTTTVVTGTSVASDFTNRIWNGSASTTSANEQQSCTPVSADSPGTSILEGYIEIQGTYTSAITPAYLLLGFTDGYNFSTSVTSGYGGTVKSLEVIVDGMTYFNIDPDQYTRYGIAGTLLKHVTNISANKSLFAIKLPNKIPVPKLKFNDYKLSINGIKPTSSKLKYGSNTYEIGTATNIYVENTGDYTAEIGNAADFALTSNTVSGTLKTVEPVINGGYFFGHALTYDGKLYGWGENSNGELGVDDNDDKTVPTLCTGITQGEVASIWEQNKRGQSRWAKTKDDKIWVTGDHDTYALPGSSADFTTFTDVSAEFGDYTLTSNNVVWASGGERATHVLMENGDVWSFGNDTGAPGILGQGGSATSDRTPRKVTGISNVTKMASGGDLVMALDSSGNVYIWGSNDVGHGSPNWGPYNTPTNIMGTGTSDLTDLLAVDSETVTDIYCSYYSMFVLTNKGTVYGTGKNGSGQLGQGNTATKTSGDGWVKIDYFTTKNITVNRLYVGGAQGHVFADTSDGWYCWGKNGSGNLALGDTTKKKTPVKWTNVSNIKTFGTGADTLYAIAEDGKYYAWGEGNTNARGDADTGDISYPKYIDTLPNILAPSFEFDGYDKIHSNKNYFTKDGKITRVNVSFELGVVADRPVYMPGWRITCNGKIVLNDTTSSASTTPSPATFTKLLSPSGSTKFTKGTTTYDVGKASIITVPDPGTYDAQLNKSGVFSIESATVPATSSTGLYTWAFHHGNFDNAYGDGDILTARDNGRFYADTPAYTSASIGTITPASAVTPTQPTLVDNIAPGSHQGVAEIGGSAVYYRKSTTSTSYIYGFHSSGSGNTIQDIAYDWVEQVWKDVYIDVSTNSIHNSFGASASEAGFAYSKASPKNPPVVYIYKSGLPGPSYGTGTLWAQFTNPYYEDTVSSTNVYLRTSIGRANRERYDGCRWRWRRWTVPRGWWRCRWSRVYGGDELGKRCDENDRCRERGFGG